MRNRKIYLILNKIKPLQENNIIINNASPKSVSSDIELSGKPEKTPLLHKKVIKFYPCFRNKQRNQTVLLVIHFKLRLKEKVILNFVFKISVSCREYNIISMQYKVA